MVGLFVVFWLVCLLFFSWLVRCFLVGWFAVFWFVVFWLVCLLFFGWLICCFLAGLFGFLNGFVCCFLFGWFAVFFAGLIVVFVVPPAPRKNLEKGTPRVGCGECLFPCP